MRKPIYGNNWKQAMLHAWLSFALLAAFYLLSFGWPGHEHHREHPAEVEGKYWSDQEAYHKASRD